MDVATSVILLVLGIMLIYNPEILHSHAHEHDHQHDNSHIHSNLEEISHQHHPHVNNIPVRL